MRARGAEWRRRKSVPRKITEVSRAPFTRIANAIARRVAPDYFLEKCAIKALHEASERYIEGLFRAMKTAAEHGRREKIIIEDMQLILKLRGGL